MLREVGNINAMCLKELGMCDAVYAVSAVFVGS